MNHRHCFVALSANTLVFAVLLAGCGDYAQPNGGGVGGSSGQAGTGGAGGSAQAGTGGSTGGSGQAGTGGSTGGSGQAGTAGTGGSGGGCVAGAGGGGGAVEVACPDPVPSDTTCGGDVLGTWAVAACPLTVTGMVDMAGLGLGCPTGEITSGSLEVTGTWTADVCGMFTDNTRTTGEQEIELPPSCLTVSGFVTTCEAVSDPFSETLGYDSVTCLDNEATGGCTCSAVIDQAGGLALISLGSPDSGTYTTAGSSLVTTKSGDDAEYSYCVSGTTMTLSLQTVGKTGTVMGPIVLQKQ